MKNTRKIKGGEEAIETLFKVVSNLKQQDQIELFIKQILTKSEQEIIGRRLLIAKMLLEGKTQAEIREKLSVSPNTFTRTRKWLTKEIPEYGKAIEIYEKQRSKQKRSKTNDYIHTNPFTLGDLKRRYPAHFLLLNITDLVLSPRKSK